MLVELTVPHEDNIEAARIRKDARYQKLLDMIARMRIGRQLISQWRSGAEGSSEKEYASGSQRSDSTIARKAQY